VDADSCPGGTLDPSYDSEVASVDVSCGAPSFCMLEYVTIEVDAPLDQFEVSTDGGMTWTDTSSGFSNLDGPTGLSDLTCVGVGECLGIIGGKIASTTDAGKVWVTHDAAADVAALSCPSAARSYVATNAAKAGSTSLRIWSTKNRGGTLAPLVRLAGSGSSEQPALSCPSALACVVIAPSTPSDLHNLAVTTNGGRTWRLLYSPELPTQRVTNLACSAAQDCTMLVTEPNSATVASYSTTDDFVDWSDATVGKLGFAGASPALSCIAAQCLATLGTRSVFSVDPTQPNVDIWTANAITTSAPLLDAVACQQDGACLALGSGVRAVSMDDGAHWVISMDGALVGDTITSLTCPLPRPALPLATPAMPAHRAGSS
jgi:photosystem II stability/assembly factor-like uncharacterized protein